METQEFVEKFSISQKQTRKVIRQRARTKLNTPAIALLKYLVSNAWGSGHKRAVAVSRRAMADNCEMTLRQVEYNLGVLAEHELITQAKEGISVHCESMQDWETKREKEAKKKAAHREAQARYQRGYKRPASVVEVQSFFVSLAEDNKQRAKAFSAQSV